MALPLGPLVQVVVGYSSDAFVSFVGGGGSGATGIARVVGGKVTSILVTDSGAGYIRCAESIYSFWRMEKARCRKYSF